MRSIIVTKRREMVTGVFNYQRYEGMNGAWRSEKWCRLTWFSLVLCRDKFRVDFKSQNDLIVGFKKRVKGR